MKLREETITKMKEIQELQETLRKSLADLNNLMLEDSEKALGVCTYPDQFIQLYHHEDVCTSSEALVLLGDIADEDTLDYAWTHNEKDCYRLKVSSGNLSIILADEKGDK